MAADSGSGPENTLILGASYGALLATKMMLAGYSVTLACRPDEAERINAEGIRVRLPVKGRDQPVEIDSRTLPGELAALPPSVIDPTAFDLVALAMQEPQYRAPGVRELLEAVAVARRPCMSIMNMPPLPFLQRIPGLDTEPLLRCYTDASVWAKFDPALMTLCSPDPQAFRPNPADPTLLQVSLPTNFKVARFAAEEPTAMLRKLQAAIEAVRFDLEGGDTEGGPVDLPVKLKVHESLFVPLAKWCMLITGNYRCIEKDDMRSIRDAVHGDLERSRAVYEWVAALCRELGADPADQVPFEKYARAAEGLAKPSSAARALFGGAPNIERVDCLVQTVAKAKGQQLEALDEIVALVDARLKVNREAA
jgi:hypothetical protein